MLVPYRVLFQNTEWRTVEASALQVMELNTTKHFLRQTKMELENASKDKEPWNKQILQQPNQQV